MITRGILLVLAILSGITLGAQAPRDSSGISIGGAVRFNTMFTLYEGESAPLPTENRNGVMWDTWRFEVSAISRGIQLTFEYRFYPGFNSHFAKKAFLSYDFSADRHLEVGVNQVPFGMLPYLGNSWWFQFPYYVGLEDDYDTGLKYRWKKGAWTYHAAYYLMAEPRGVSEPSYGSFPSARYSYDIIPEDGYNGNNERNQFNLRAEYAGDNWFSGVSGQLGEIYNNITRSSAWGWAAAWHGSLNLNERMNIKGQFTHFDYRNVPSDSGAITDFVNMGAYGFGTYQVTSQAHIISIGFSYSRPLDWGPLESITFYEDYSLMHKYGDYQLNGVTYQYEHSHHNVLGFKIKAGNIFAYFDIATGVHHPWLSDVFGGYALAAGRGVDVALPLGADLDGDSSNGIQPNYPDENPHFNTRFNINLGYYF